MPVQYTPGKKLGKSCFTKMFADGLARKGLQGVVKGIFQFGRSVNLGCAQYSGTLGVWGVPGLPDI